MVTPRRQGNLCDTTITYRQLWQTICIHICTIYVTVKSVEKYPNLSYIYIYIYTYTYTYMYTHVRLLRNIAYVKSAHTHTHAHM